MEMNAQIKLVKFRLILSSFVLVWLQKFSFSYSYFNQPFSFSYSFYMLNSCKFSFSLRYSTKMAN